MPLVSAPVNENAESTSLSTPPACSMAWETIFSHSLTSFPKIARMPASRPNSCTKSLIAWKAAVIPWNNAVTESTSWPETIRPTTVNTVATMSNETTMHTRRRDFTINLFVELGKYASSKRAMMRLSRYATTAPAKNGRNTA